MTISQEENKPLMLAAITQNIQKNLPVFDNEIFYPLWIYMVRKYYGFILYTAGYSINNRTCIM